MLQDINSPETAPPAAPSKSRVFAWTIFLGIAMIAMPLVQALFALQSSMQLADFLPMSMVIDHLLSSAALWHATALAGICMLVGGLMLLSSKRRWGWALGLPALVFAVLNVVETLLISLWPAFHNPKALEFIIDIGLEILELTYYVPVIFLILQIVGIILLLRRGTRRQFGIERRQLWIATAVLAALLLDFHLSILIYFQSQQP